MLFEPEREEDVVAGDRVGCGDGPLAADRRDARLRSSLHLLRAGRSGRVVVDVGVGLPAGLGRRSARAGSVGRPARSGARSGGRSGRGPTPPPRPTRRRTASPAARPRRGSSGARRSSARRPRGRRRPPRRPSSGGRGRCPSACRPSARRGGSGPCCPTPWRAGRPSAGATSGATAATGSPARRSPSSTRARFAAMNSSRFTSDVLAGEDHRLAVRPRPPRPRSGHVPRRSARPRTG